MQGYLDFDIFDLDSVNKVSNTFLKNGGIAKQLDAVIDDAVNEVMQKSVARMRVLMSTMPTRDGNLSGSRLASTINEYRLDKGFVIEVEGDYALYVEFGTGIIGATHPHPDRAMFDFVWLYDVHNHGYAGWYYIGEDGKKHFTTGMPSRPFMYQTYLYVRRIMTKTINKHLKKVLG